MSNRQRKKKMSENGSIYIEKLSQANDENDNDEYDAVGKQSASNSTSATF